MKVRVHPLHLAVLFGAIILLTRSTQFAFPGAPPDATLALMLLGGMWIRRWAGFAGLVAAAFAADCLAIGGLGVPDYCVSPAYVGLLPTYLTVWLCGSWLQARRLHAALFAWLGTMLVASLAAFIISNAFWFAFSGGFSWWTLTRFAAAVAPYFPAYAGPALAYVALAWLVRAAALHLTRSRSPEPAS
jgi:hypothetical protein